MRQDLLTRVYKKILKFSHFCDDKLKSIRYIPRMNECYDATFPGPEGDESKVPQKYLWLQGVCAAFVMFTDMGWNDFTRIMGQLCRYVHCLDKYKCVF